MSRDGARAARDLLEAALLDLPNLPPAVDRAPVARMLERAVDRLSRFEGGEGSIDEYARAAAAALAGAAAMLGAAAFGDEVARRAMRRLHAAQRHIEALRGEGSADPIGIDPTGSAGDRATHDAPRRSGEPRLRVSHGSPMIHAFAGGPLAPPARLGGHGEDPAEGGAPRRLRPSYDPAAALHVEQLRRLARDCVEELGVLGGLREAPDTVAWSPVFERYDARLLRDLDALAALDAPVMFDGRPALRLDVLREVCAWADDAFVVDPVRAFARAFVLGCAEGDDPLRAAIVALKQSDPRTRDAQRDALALASSPGIGRAMEDLSRGEDAALAAFALDVMHLRREARATVAAPLLAHPEARVRASAARCLGAAVEREAAATLLASALEVETDDGVIAAGAEALIRLGRAEGLVIARRRAATRVPLADGPRAAIHRVLAVAGGPEDVATLIAPLEGAPTDADIDAVGRHGHTEGVTALIAALDRSEKKLKPFYFRAKLARAIRQVTGLEGDDGRAIQPAWIEASARLDPALKYRRGQPFDPIASIDDLGGEALALEREALALEVALASSGAARIETSTWTLRQLADIEAARAILADRGAPRPGVWPSARLAAARGARWR